MLSQASQYLLAELQRDEQRDALVRRCAVTYCDVSINVDARGCDVSINVDASRTAANHVSSLIAGVCCIVCQMRD